MHCLCYILYLLVTCIAILCPSLTAPSNGTVILSSPTLEFGSTARYVCDTGYGLDGEDMVRTCGGDGTSPDGEWSGAPPICDCEIAKN